MANVSATSPPPVATATSGSHDNGHKQKAASPHNAPVVARRPTRSGRLEVDKQGEFVYKSTPSSTLVASLQLGLQVSIGRIEPKPRRDILMTDFEVVDTVDFPAAGSTNTPAHKYRDFTFKTYSPVAFRFFREAFGILAEDYLLAMCAHSLREITNPGASGSLFYLSADDAFIIKTVQKKEAHFLQKLLPGYYLNLTQNKKTLLPKFFGLYRYKCGTVNIRIVVMNNLLPSTLKYHEKYDLKGSTYKRKAVGSELGKSSPTFKDLDFQEKHTEGGGVFLFADKYEILMMTLDRDCRVLESFGIMDYSLLLGVYNIDQSKRDGETSSRTNSPGGEREEERQQLLVPSRIELSKNFSIISVENIPLAVEGEDTSESPPRYPEGYIQGKLKGDRVLVYLGIIDILQSYRLKKKLEHTLKSMITDGNTVSVHNPSYYARRFYDFLEKIVFQKEKGRTRSRKVSKLPGGVRKVPITPLGVVRTQSMPHGRERHYSHPHTRRGGGPSLSPTATVFSPPPLGEAATPGKSNLKPNSQFDKKLTSSSVSPSTSETMTLPEIPAIEVFSASGDEESGAESKVARTPIKGVRFADEVGRAKTEGVVSSEAAGSGVEREGDKGEMDSVDFDKATGTSTPIAEESPSLAKRCLATPDSHTLSSSGADYSSSSAAAEREKGEGEGVILETVAPRREGEREGERKMAEGLGGVTSTTDKDKS